MSQPVDVPTKSQCVTVRRRMENPDQETEGQRGVGRGKIGEWATTRMEVLHGNHGENNQVRSNLSAQNRCEPCPASDKSNSVGDPWRHGLLAESWDSIGRRNCWLAPRVVTSWEFLRTEILNWSRSGLTGSRGDKFKNHHTRVDSFNKWKFKNSKERADGCHNWKFNIRQKWIEGRTRSRARRQCTVASCSAEDRCSVQHDVMDQNTTDETFDVSNLTERRNTNQWRKRDGGITVAPVALQLGTLFQSHIGWPSQTRRRSTMGLSACLGSAVSTLASLASHHNREIERHLRLRPSFEVKLGLDYMDLTLLAHKKGYISVGYGGGRVTDDGNCCVVRACRRKTLERAATATAMLFENSYVSHCPRPVWDSFLIGKVASCPVSEERTLTRLDITPDPSASQAHHQLGYVERTVSNIYEICRSAPWFSSWDECRADHVSTQQLSTTRLTGSNDNVRSGGHLARSRPVWNVKSQRQHWPIRHYGTNDTCVSEQMQLRYDLQIRAHMTNPGARTKSKQKTHWIVTSASLCTLEGFRSARTNSIWTTLEWKLGEELMDDSVELSGVCTTRRCTELHQGTSDQSDSTWHIPPGNKIRPMCHPVSSSKCCNRGHVTDGAGRDDLDQDGPPSEAKEETRRQRPWRRPWRSNSSKANAISTELEFDKTQQLTSSRTSVRSRF